MHFDLNSIIGLVATLVGIVIAHALKTPKDHERASLIAKLADDIAAVVIVLYPNAPWATLVKEIVNKLKAAAGIPTQNVAILENAATGALMRLGRAPENAKPK